MESTAHLRYVRMSPRKIAVVVDLVRGKPVSEALNILQFTKRAAARPVAKLIKTAVANATDLSKGQVDVDTLYVKTISVDQGPTAAPVHAARHGPGHPHPQEDAATSTWCSRRAEVTRRTRGANTWVRKFIRSGSASASSRPGTRKWFEDKNYAQWLHEDIRIREFVKKSLGHAASPRSRSSARRTR